MITLILITYTFGAKYLRIRKILHLPTNKLTISHKAYLMETLKYELKQNNNKPLEMFVTVFIGNILMYILV